MSNTSDQSVNFKDAKFLVHDKPASTKPISKYTLGFAFSAFKHLC